MANTYIKPETKTFKVESQQIMQGVSSGDSLAGEYKNTDVTYGKDNGIGEGLPAVNIWEE